jgi:hypothetical protein
MFTVESARKLLMVADVFYPKFDEDDDPQLLNMNDVWGWGCADAERVSDDELPEVAKLFWLYGNCGILYWVSKKRGGIRSEFKDNNRFIDFVEHEEELRNRIPDGNERAYTNIQYTLGEKDDQESKN